MGIFGGIFDVDAKRTELEQIEKVLSDPDFWGKSEESRQVLRRRSRLQNTLTLAEECRGALGDVEALIQLHDEGEDVLADLSQEISVLEERVAKTEISTFLSGTHDASSAIVTIHPGAGGTESQDWAEMLLRMYLRWSEKHDYKTEVTDFQEGDEAGVKSVTFLVEGEFGYGYLSAEIGVHRLVRISPFDAAARRHTSFASVFVTPELEDDVDVVIDDKDLKIDTYRSSGSGGQHVNVTDSAVRITHLPTAIVVQCQNERSQHRNKATALKILKSKLYEYEMEKKRKERDAQEDAKPDIGWGSQIRSYTLHPYRLVKDHRTKQEMGDVDSVLDGEIDTFIEAFMKQRSQEKGKQERLEIHGGDGRISQEG